MNLSNNHASQYHTMNQSAWKHKSSQQIPILLECSAFPSRNWVCMLNLADSEYGTNITLTIACLQGRLLSLTNYSHPDEDIRLTMPVILNVTVNILQHHYTV
jgi:hypothetical protein